jgi:hypothetical protein
MLAREAKGELCETLRVIRLRQDLANREHVDDDRRQQGDDPMSTHQARTEPRHDHAPDSDDMWAWIVIGLLGGAVGLAVWIPFIAIFRA